MVVNITENIYSIKNTYIHEITSINRVMEYIPGPMEGNMMDFGKMVNNMGMQNIILMMDHTN